MKNERAMYAISYGLFVLTARQGERDNGCIINTAVQVTAQPNRVTIAVNKGNLTHDMIQETGKFNLSVLSEEADFQLFKRFGFQSGRDSDKFAGTEDQVRRGENGLLYLHGEPTPGCPAGSCPILTWAATPCFWRMWRMETCSTTRPAPPMPITRATSSLVILPTPPGTRSGGCVGYAVMYTRGTSCRRTIFVPGASTQPRILSK